MEKHVKNDSAINYLTASEHVRIVFYPTNEELAYKGKDLATIFCKAAQKIFGLETTVLLEKAFIGYIHALTIIDDFDKDTERDEYESQILYKANPEAYRLYKKNRLGMQNIQGVINTLYFLRDHHNLLKEPEFEDGAKAIFKRFLPGGIGEVSISAINEGNYDMMSEARKIILADKVAEFAKEICIEIIKQAKKSF